MATDIFSGSLDDFKAQLLKMPDGPDKTAALAALPSAISSDSSVGQIALAAINGMNGGGSSATPASSDSSASVSPFNPSTWLPYLGRGVMILLGIIIIAAGIFMLKDYKPGGGAT